MSKSAKIQEYTWEGKTLRVGDFVVAYQKGYHVVVGIERRFHLSTDPEWTRVGAKVGDEYNPIIIYRRIVSESGKQTSSKKNIQCDWVYVKVVDEKFIAERKAEAIQKWDNLLRMLTGYQGTATPDKG